MLEYKITARRVDEHGSIAQCKDAELVIDTDLKGRKDAFNPAELLLAAVAACILKNMERVAPMIHFEYRGVSISMYGDRQDSPPKMNSIEYDIEVDTDETEHKLQLMHNNIKKFGTVYNTVAPGTELSGVIRKT
ncbi:FIG00966261: hypothetical protein [hydrothermal vent metagenome]|uniref:OsmC/Ohr family protein n=1 Tax=hydrothermal vent metagenome TaxID=652676 RepID=A0A3B0XQA2_9ZZZZ